MKRIYIFLSLCILTYLSIAQPVNQIDSLGRKQGHWKKYNGDTLKYDGYFKDDKPIGEFKYFYFGGAVKTIANYDEDGVTAKVISFFTDGKKLAEGTYYNRKKHGKWEYWDETGMISSIENYNKGSREGEWKTLYNNGRLNMLTTYKDNIENGPWEQWYDDSIPMAKSNYSNGYLDGLTQFFNISGKVMISGTMKMGAKDGLWMYFCENGTSDKRITHRNDEVVKEEICTQAAGENKYVDVTTIAYIWSESGKSSIRLNDGTDIVSPRNIDDLSKSLNEYKFYKINQDYIIAIWSVKNRKVFSRDNRKLVLYPAPNRDVLVSADALDGFMHWAGLIKEEE